MTNAATDTVSNTVAGRATEARAGSRTAGYIERRLSTVVRLTLLGVAVAVQFGINATVLLDVSRSSRTELAVYLVLAGTGIGCATALLTGGRPPAVVRVAGGAVLLGCSVVMSATLPLEAVPRAEHWSLGLIGWYGLALLFDVPLGWVLAFLLTHVVVFAWPMVAAGAGFADLAAMAVVVVSVIGFQTGVAMGARLLRTIAGGAAREAREEERLRVGEETAAAAARNHERRYAELRTTTIPLLAGLAAGTLDPRAEPVRRRCAVEAARMRRLFGEREDVPDRLVHELGAVIDVAERHGATVFLSVRGVPRELPDDVRRRLLVPISEALVCARGEVRVTVLYGEDQVRVSVRCPAPDLSLARVDHGDVEVTESVSAGQLWLETSWRSP